MEKLKSVFKRFKDSFPEVFCEDSITFKSDNLTTQSYDFMLNSLALMKEYHYYDNYYRTVQLNWFSRKEDFKYFGLLILSVVFNNDTQEAVIKITNPKSTIKKLIIRFSYNHNFSYIFDYKTIPFSYEYWPTEIERIPWTNRKLNHDDYPCFFLTNEKEMIVDEEDWAGRDTVVITGTDVSLILLAELFLNISNKHNKIPEISLEGEMGFRGVGPGSAEVKIWLPGSTGWREDLV